MHSGQLSLALTFDFCSLKRCQRQARRFSFRTGSGVCGVKSCHGVAVKRAIRHFVADPLFAFFAGNSCSALSARRFGVAAGPIKKKISDEFFDLILTFRLIGRSKYSAYTTSLVISMYYFCSCCVKGPICGAARSLARYGPISCIDKISVCSLMPLGLLGRSLLQIIRD